MIQLLAACLELIRLASDPERRAATYAVLLVAALLATAGGCMVAFVLRPDPVPVHIWMLEPEPRPIESNPETPV